MSKKYNYTYTLISNKNNITYILSGYELKQIFNITRTEYNKYFKPYGKIDIDKIKDIKDIPKDKLEEWKQYDKWIITDEVEID